MDSYKDLAVWQKAIDLAVEIYRLTETMPSDERYGLTAQMRRAVVSISSNIAEGKARTSTGDFVRFVAIARGSVAELETQITLSERLGFIDNDSTSKARALTDEVSRVLAGLRNSLQS